MGRLEVLRGGSWGGVCYSRANHYFGINETRVFCYQLGFG